TRVQCRIEANTRARGGDTLGEAITWAIDVAPPRLLSSWPPVTRARPDDTGAGPLFWKLDTGARPSIFDPWHDPVVLVFDRIPDPAAWRRLRLNGPEGEVPLVEATLDPQLWQAIGNEADPAHAIAVRSREPLQPGSSYQLAVPEDLPFPGCELTLDSPITIEIPTPSDPRILGARGSAEGVFLYPTNPIDPDSLSARLQLTPDPGDWTVHTPWRGATGQLESEETNAIWIEGSFPAGESVEVRVLPGLRDAFGLAAMRPFVFQVQIPHRDAALTLAPSSGALLAGGAEYLRLTARNVGPVRVRAAWVRSAEMPIAYSNAASQALAHQRATLPWQDRWDIDEVWDPGIADDETHAHDLRLGEIPNPPRDVQALWVEAIAEPIYGRGSARDSLRAAARVELATIGLSCALGERHGLLWATDLSSGQPLARADIALHKKVEPEDAVPAALDPVWNGKTDEDGLVWIPGSVQLDSLGIELAMVQVPGRRGWLALPHGPNPEPGDDVRAAMVVDRSELHPGDRLLWKAWVRRVDRDGLSRVALSRISVTFQGQGWSAEQKRPLDLTGSATGSYSIPASAPAGPLLALIRDPQTGRVLGELPLTVEATPGLALATSLTPSAKRVLSGNDVDLRAAVTRRGGTPLGPMPLEWSIESAPWSWAPAGWEAFRFHDPWLEAAGISPERAPERLDQDGVAAWRISTRPRDRESDLRISATVRPRDLTDPALTARCSFGVLCASTRVGVRAVQDRPEHRGAAAWEWVVVDTSGAIVAGAEVEATVTRLLDPFDGEGESIERAARSGELRESEPVYRRTLVSTTDPQTLAFSKPVAGRYALHLQLAEGAKARAAALSAEPRPPVPREKSATMVIEPGDDSITLPNTPASGAQTLLVLHDRDLIRARSTFLRGFPTIAIPTRDLLPPSVGITALQIGTLPRANAQGARPILPAFSVGTTAAPIPLDRLRPRIAIVPRSVEGDTISVEITARASNGRPTPGEVVLGIYDADESDPLATWNDPLAALLADRGRPIFWADTRNQLALSGEEPSLDLDFDLGTATDSSLAAAVPRARALYWTPALPLGSDGRVVAHIPVGPRAHRYRLSAIVTTPENEIGVAEADLSGAPAARLVTQLPEEIRVGDRVSLPISVRNRTDQSLSVWLGANLTGGRIEGATEANEKLDPHALRTVYLPITAPQPGTISLELALRTGSSDGPLLDQRRVTITAARPVLTERRIERGSTTGRTETRIDLEDPLLQEAGSLQIVLAPSLAVELRDPLLDLVRSDIPGREAEITRLRAAEGLLELNEKLFDVPPEAELRRDIADRLDLLDAAPALPSDPETAAYLDAYALWTLGELAAHGHRIDADLMSRTERRMADWRAHGFESGPTKRDLALGAFQIWVRLTYGRTEPQADEIQLGQLLARSEELGVVGKLYAALALDRYAQLPRTP
ncbi:MAG: hypothetical protein KC729_12450, partial [Candidatus Eisenbacteria bacterium]|nr:hypothetical protein [Candidatus Eisenbacteria bacterium]